jgi:hypothetical protein
MTKEHKKRSLLAPFLVSGIFFYLFNVGFDNIHTLFFWKNLLLKHSINTVIHRVDYLGSRKYKRFRYVNVYLTSLFYQR